MTQRPLTPLTAPARHTRLGLLLAAALAVTAALVSGCASGAASADRETLSIAIGHGQQRTVTVTRQEATRIAADAAKIAAAPVGGKISTADYYSVVGTPRDLPLPPLVRQERQAGPDRVTIPALHASLPIHVSGISGLDQMEVAGGVRQVSWLDTSASPRASSGSTLLAFHRDTGGGARGVWSPFFGIRDIGIGSRVYVTWHGTTTAYEITGYNNVPKDALPAAITALGGEHRLTFITCGGPLVKQKDGLLHWSTRLLTTAKEVER